MELKFWFVWEFWILQKIWGVQAHGGPARFSGQVFALQAHETRKIRADPEILVCMILCPAGKLYEKLVSVSPQLNNSAISSSYLLAFNLQHSSFSLVKWASNQK